MKRLVAIGVVAAMVLVAFVLTPQRASATPGTATYPDQELSGGFQTGHFNDIWDLTVKDLRISFIYDANGLVDIAGAHAWAELGIRPVGYGDFNPWGPGGAGVWLATDYDWTPGTFGPDPVGHPILDMDDKLILQRQGGTGEGNYNLPNAPPDPGTNYGVWFDRDGVDEWQATYWGSLNGQTYNTDGVYDIVITLQANDAISGTAFMTVNGVQQGFYAEGWKNAQPEIYPAGMTFTGDMKQMQVFYGLFGYGATHSVAFRDITVAGFSWLGPCSVSVDSVNKVITLLEDCTTDHTVYIPDGWTLDGAGPDWIQHSITAINPVTGHFVGAVVQNAGPVAYVGNLTVTASGLADVCDDGVYRLRGIMFEGASGSIINSTVTNINQGASGCQEGNAIEIRNEPFDGSHPATKSVEIAFVNIVDYQKTGIVANGDVDVNIHHSVIGASATQHYLAANSVQFGYGATGSLHHSLIYGNQWFGWSELSDYAATAVLLFESYGVKVSNNNIRGNSDIGIYVYGDKTNVDNNRVYDEGPDSGGYDIGIGNYGNYNSITRNKVRGFNIPYEGDIGGKNKVVPGPKVGGSP